MRSLLPHSGSLLPHSRSLLPAGPTGIGPNSVLYRALRDMLLAYPATGVKAAILKRKAVRNHQEKTAIFFIPKKV